jgi:hypothetical protein
VRLAQIGWFAVRINWLDRLKRHASLTLLLAAATIAVLIAILWFSRATFSSSEAVLLF